MLTLMDRVIVQLIGAQRTMNTCALLRIAHFNRLIVVCCSVQRRVIDSAAVDDGKITSVGRCFSINALLSQNQTT